VVTTFLVVGFLAVHGLLHLVVWLPKPEPDPVKPPPFEPDHSAVLTAAHVPAAATHALAIGLATGACAAYLLAALVVALGLGWAVGVAVAAALIGLLLKGLYFHPWLSFGVLLDLGVLSAALWEWPVALV